MFYLDSQELYRSELLDRVDWLEHGFGTRRTEGWPDAGRLVGLRQIHTNWVRIAQKGAIGRIDEGDALITRERGLLLSVRTADCVPILMADRSARAVAAVHAGWRGTVAEAAPEAARAMAREFGTRPEDLVVAIGPAIGECCYEVGPEVGRQFERWFPEKGDLGHRTRINLAEANRRQMIAAGVPEDQVEVADVCTFCGVQQFHSYRREGKQAGRMTAAIGVRLD